ncbi:metal ABC transporter ATP-binding protein [Pseudobacillus badius]|uniref:metal ABC transporter ATP-binding protein n=1 Tax=Bacillus badius TaxID=1455 RepID=UPI0007B04DBC|nr:metal ABC transporter ATP-binding protein [Bacillus badius]KZN99704.1 manganese transporter [Bacillus badius]MED0666491.1 metal ABC transporter ATP-binding protein [Bacillus badius]OCS85809.1 manganese transporter [Bacillus badius]OVE51833.1 manganese transporter [Bacillus badius]TDW03260.1 iron/zinc/copper transport system ATP-binding protein [Bacillus badius]
MDSALTVKNLFVSYHGNEALRDVSFSVDPGSLIGIIGPNGAGKSTLIKALLNLIPKDQGEVKIYGKSIKEMRKFIAYVPQRSYIDWDFPITVLDAVIIGCYPALGLFKRPKKKEKAWALQCLEKVGMQDFSKRQIGELSGGQQQRVFLARALAQKAQVFFLDEPFVGIDAASEETIIHILKELRTNGKTILVVHHDLSKVNDYFDQLIVLNKELIGSGKIDQVLQADVLSKAYSGRFSFLDKLEVQA